MNKTFTRRSWSVASAALCVALSVPLTARADLTIGVSIALSGPGAALGLPAKNALELWPSTINGEKVRLMVLDDAGDPIAATRNARRFAEEKADAMIGSANTPSTIAMAVVADELKIPQLSPAPAELPSGKDAWTFRMAMPAAFYLDGLLEHMQKSGVKTLAFLGYGDAYGDSYVQALTPKAAALGIKVVATERFARADTSVTAQVLRVTGANPDAVLVVAVGGGAAMPQKTLKERGYKGKIYHTPSSVSSDFLRLAGVDAEGTFLASGPEQIPEQLPATSPARKVGLEFVTDYEKKFGPNTRNQFAAHIFDFGQVLNKVVPIAMQKAKPGTPEFHAALRDALESSGVVSTSKGPLQYSASNHWGLGPDARVVLVVNHGDYKLAP